MLAPSTSGSWRTLKSPRSKSPCPERPPSWRNAPRSAQVISSPVRLRSSRRVRADLSKTAWGSGKWIGRMRTRGAAKRQRPKPYRRTKSGISGGASIISRVIAGAAGRGWSRRASVLSSAPAVISAGGELANSGATGRRRGPPPREDVLRFAIPADGLALRFQVSAPNRDARPRDPRERGGRASTEGSSCRRAARSHRPAIAARPRRPFVAMKTIVAIYWQALYLMS